MRRRQVFGQPNEKASNIEDQDKEHIALIKQSLVTSFPPVLSKRKHGKTPKNRR